MTDFIWKTVLVMLWCAFKFMVGFFVALGFGFNFIHTLLVTVAGGMIGVIFYLYLWQLILHYKNKWFPGPPKTGGIKVNRRKRMMVKLINRFEIYGIAALTPILLSVPVGVILANLIEPNKWRIKVVMFFSFVGWVCLGYGLYTLFGIRLDEVIKNLIAF